jgi:NAD(P)H-hydrate epimerase
MGITGALRPELESWVDAANAVGSFVISVDVPSGVDADTGHVDGAAVRADTTVTFSAPKIGLLQYPGAGFAGEVVLADVGIPPAFLMPTGAPEVWIPSEYRAVLPLPEPEVHKNQRGRVLVVAGSGAYPGAAILAAMGAQRMGAGYVSLAVPESALAAARAHLVSVVVIGMPENPARTFASRDTERLIGMAAEYDAVVLGPGLTVSRGAVMLARTLVKRLDVPLVVDADGLNALVDASDLLAMRDAPTVITPHAGEAARLLGSTADAVQSDRLTAAAKLALGEAVCLLKGAGTVVAGGGRALINTSGTPALATAGTGDVLAGMVGTLLAQGIAPFEAAALAAYLHGRAGEAAAEALSPICVRAEDVAEHLPAAVGDMLEDW